MPVKLFFGGRNNAIAGLDSNLITTPGTQYICLTVVCTYILVNASQVPPYPSGTREDRRISCAIASVV